MQVWMTFMLVLQILTALVMIGLVLIQHGKGADMGASFGSGASGSLFGATGSANFLSRSTAICATVFFLCTLGLSYLNTHGATRDVSSSGSVLDQPVTPAGAASAAASAAIGAIPTGQPAAIPAPAATPASAAVPAPAAAVPPASAAGK